MTTPSNTNRPWWLPMPVRVHAAWWALLVSTLLALEYLTGFHRQFPLLYVVPVSLAAWYSGRWPALALAVVVASAHVVFQVVDAPQENVGTAVATAAFRTGVIAVMVLWFARLAEHERALRLEVQTLEKLLPICSFCKSIKNEVGQWERLEKYLSSRSETQFAQAVCPTCLGFQPADDTR